ncbi:hypothetical protein HRS9139_08941 [Pyrenophora teres f. teres]|uniref:BTB domain containing protein n=1 Tax=Pyrenophora teres f. teres TaxID=97479 RepID=A0A6S6W8H1_9PLEO|nr:hypothetical protein HRS9139_08941 [Pyrenophora teres f. teres]KAE8861217.1 hypothetical protein PTNB29_06312 [Pyrenophora teres f. teres]CAE7193345.1 BTB domain containing protein [Pyrenophora teres f. teres]
MSTDEERKLVLSPSVAARDSALAIVKVGADKTTYTLYRSLLVEHSEYFKKALTGTWKEAREGVVILQDVECIVFEVFIDWLYTQRLPKEIDSSADETGCQPAGDSLLLQVKALIFGDRIVSPNFHQAVRDATINGLIGRGAPPYYFSIGYAFDNLPDDHPILDLIVEVQCREFSESMDTEDNGEIKGRAALPNDFLIRVMIRYSSFKENGWPESVINPCDYHGHVSEEDREKCPINKKALKQEV